MPPTATSTTAPRATTVRGPTTASVYDPARAAAQARADAQAFAARCADARRATAGSARSPSTPSCSAITGTRGRRSSQAFVEACADIGLPLTGLDDALHEAASAPWPDGLDAATSWGQPPTLWTWSGPQVADMARAQREAELRVVARGAGVPERAVRELLALQASDWPFLETRALAGPYARERFAGHLAALDEALDPVRSPDPVVRHLAPLLRIAPLARAVNRVLILTWEYPPIVEGGLARHVRKLAEQLAVAGDRRPRPHARGRDDERRGGRRRSHGAPRARAAAAA